MPFDILRTLDAIRDLADLTRSEKSALVMLTLRAKDGRCFPSYFTLAKDMGNDTDRSTAIRAVRSLIKRGLVRRESRPGSAGPTSNLYTIQVVPSGVTPPPSGVTPPASGLVPPGVVASDHQLVASRHSEGTNLRNQDRRISLKEPKEEKRSEPRKRGQSDSLRGSRLPADWQPSAELVAWAKVEGVDAEATVPEFVDYWTGVPGRSGLKLDWDATFRNHVRRLQTQGRAPEIPAHKKPGYKSPSLPPCNTPIWELPGMEHMRPPDVADEADIRDFDTMIAELAANHTLPPR